MGSAGAEPTACSRQIKDASAKMGLATVSLYNVHPVWTGAKP